MRILVVAPSAYTLGGLATWLDYLLPGLTEKQWDVTLGLVSGPRHHQPRQYLAVHPFCKSVTMHSACGTTRDRISAVRKAIQSVQPDLVLTVNIPHALKAAALERSEGGNVRAVMTCHGIQEDLFADMRLLAEDLDAVVCTNRLACELAARLGQVSPDRIFHCPYGTQVRAKLPAPAVNEKLTVGYAGRLEQPQKRIHDLVGIAAELRKQDRDFRFIVAGSGPEEETLKEMLVRQHFTDHFIFLGFVAPEQLEERLYSRVDALLVTSCWETGPIVIWEAMAAGTPIVTSRYTGSGQERLLWHQHNCLMFDIGATEDAAAQIVALGDDGQMRQRLRNQAFCDVSERLSCQVSLNKWDTILRQMMQRSPRNGEVNDVVSSRNTGRLSRLFGERGAGLVRRLLHKLPPNTGPGGEWPHTMAGSTMNDEEFFQLATRLDRREEALADQLS